MRRRRLLEPGIRNGRESGFATASDRHRAYRTIGFMMDCDTTGIEPDLALIKYKNWWVAE